MRCSRFKFGLLLLVAAAVVTVAAVCLSLAFFFAELIVGPIWSVPMDIAPRYAGTASGMMNFGFGVSGLVSPLSFGYGTRSISTACRRSPTTASTTVSTCAKCHGSGAADTTSKA